MSAGQCSVLSLSFIMCLVSCSVGKATPEQTDQRIMFYVFGSDNIYIIDPKSKEISSTIGPDGVCTKSNNRYSRWACLNNSVCRNFSHASPKIWLITMWIVTLLLLFFFIRNKCSFGKNTVVRDELIFFSDMPGNRVHVIDVQQQKVLNGFLQ